MTSRCWPASCRATNKPERREVPARRCWTPAPVAYDEVFAQGWPTGDLDYAGRPTHTIQAKDGSLLVADDRAGAVH